MASASSPALDTTYTLKEFFFFIREGKGTLISLTGPGLERNGIQTIKKKKRHLDFVTGPGFKRNGVGDNYILQHALFYALQC